MIIIALAGVCWLAGGSLTAPVNHPVGNCTADLNCEDVEFAGDSGSPIKGWFIQGEPGKGAVILMHGVRSDRSSMIGRMHLLRQAGYSVLAFDFQASGESPGKQITFGYLESFDAEAAIRLMREKLPGEKLGVIGISMGGAAFLLQKAPSPVDAVVLEMVYPTMVNAVEDRLNLRLFNGAGIFSPLLTWQLKPRLGISVDELRPIDKISGLRMPKLIIAGEKDQHTKLEETLHLFETAAEPKELWIVPNAEHTDLYEISPIEYKVKVLSFFQKNLRN